MRFFSPQEEVEVVQEEVRRQKRLMDMKRDVRLGRIDLDIKDIRRRKKIVDMRSDPDYQLAVMRERRRLREPRVGVRGDSSSLAAEYRASIGSQPERREFRTAINVDGNNKITGYAAVFNGLSEPLRCGNRSFRERILPGAFDRCLAAGADIRGLLNHNADLLLGRTTSGTMRVSADDRGLRYEIDLPDTSYARDLAVSLKRRDIDQSSFGFYTVDDNWLQDGSGETIREVVTANVFDCSVVVFPAYTQTSSGIA